MSEDALWIRQWNQQSSKQRLPTMRPQTTSTMVHWRFGTDMDDGPLNGSSSNLDRPYSTSVAEAVPRPFLPRKLLDRTVASSPWTWQTGCSQWRERKPL